MQKQRISQWHQKGSGKQNHHCPIKTKTYLSDDSLEMFVRHETTRKRVCLKRKRESNNEIRKNIF